MTDHEKEELIQAIRGIADEKGATSVPRHEFLARTGYSEHAIITHFGSYNALVDAAGLVPNRLRTRAQYSDSELIAEIERVLELPDAVPTARFFEHSSPISVSTVMHRFGSWTGALQAVLQTVEEASPLGSKIQRHLDALGGATSTERATEAGPPTSAAQPHHSHLRGTESPIFGDYISFRGLLHAPVNEQGVVFLFGMVCLELGYIVEAVKPGFPDCEAKRRIGRSPARWQRVRIEFEFESRNFRDHGHDPQGCDLVVCWRHNWPDCPLEVLELSSVLPELDD